MLLIEPLLVVVFAKVESWSLRTFVDKFHLPTARCASACRAQSLLRRMFELIGAIALGDPVALALGQRV